VLAVSIGVRDSKRGFLSVGLAAAGMGFAVMTKGLIGVVLPLFTIAIFWMLARERWSIGKWHWAIGILIFSAIVLPWHLAMNAMHSDFLDYYILKGQLFRYLSGSESLDVEPLSVIPFLVMALVWFFPWVLFLPQAIISAVRDLRRGASDRDLIVLAAVMAVVVIGFFGSSRARLEYYSIPAMPAFAILIGRWWSRESLPSRGMGNGFIAMILVAVIGACLLLTYSEINPSIIRKYYAVIDENYRNSLAVKHLDTEPTLIPALDDLFSSMVSVIVVFFSSGLVGLWAQAKGRRRDAFAAVILSAVVLLVNIHRGLVVFEPYRSVAPLARQVATLAGKEDIVAVTGPYERASPLAFYTGRRVTVVNGFQGDLDYGRVRDPSSALYFLDSSGFSEVWRSDQRVFLITDASPLSIVESSSLLKPVYRMGRQPGRILVSNMP
jgi:hypothetical protein